MKLKWFKKKQEPTKQPDFRKFDEIDKILDRMSSKDDKQAFVRKPRMQPIVRDRSQPQVQRNPSLIRPKSQRIQSLSKRQSVLSNSSEETQSTFQDFNELKQVLQAIQHEKTWSASTTGETKIDSPRALTPDRIVNVVEFDSDSDE